MGRLKESIDRLTFGNPRRCVRFVLWRFLDSLVTSVPSVVMVVATWLLVQPIVHPGAALDFVALWACVAVLAAQVLASYATSHKVYVLSCAGTADAVLDARLAMGEKLRRCRSGSTSATTRGTSTACCCAITRRWRTTAPRCCRKRA